MRIVRTISAILFSVWFLFSTSSCVVFVGKHDNGKHRGWYKNPKNPHFPGKGNPGKGNPGKGKPKKK